MAARTPTSRTGAVIVVCARQVHDDDVLWSEVAGSPLIAWTIAAFERTPEIAARVLVVSSERVEVARALARRPSRQQLRIVTGGPRWHDAVSAGLAALPSACEWVVIHEGARPLVTPELITAVIAAARPSGAAAAAAPVNETIKQVSRGIVIATSPREHLALLHTPQVYARRVLQVALESEVVAANVPDGPALGVAAGVAVATYPAGRDTLKVASPDDLAAVEAALRLRAGARQHV